MSFSWGTQYSKLKTNLQLAANRLRLLQKKKTEQAIKARGEIAEFLNSDKEDRARIRVENIIREDFVVEAYELLESYCELLLARFGIIQQMKDLDDGIAEAVSSLLWVAPRIGHEIPEFKVINDELTHKYGKQFAEAARMNQLPEPSRVSPKLIHKLSVNAPSKLLVEKYLITIAQSAGIDFTPDPKVMRDDDDEIARAERNLINFMNEEQYGWSVKSDDGRGGGGGTLDRSGMDNTLNGSTHFPANVSVPAPNAAPQQKVSPPPEYAPPPPPQYPQSGGGGMYPPAVPTYPNPATPHHLPYHHQHQQNFHANPPPSEHIYETPPTQPPHHHQSPPMHPSPGPLPRKGSDNDFLLPKLPDPPSDLPTTRGGGRGGGGGGLSQPPDGLNQDLDFDALARRFEELKKKL